METITGTEMPPFSVMGLLMGGRGYASGWFQQRDKVALADAAIAKERQDRATFAEGMLADPRWKNYLANPNDRQAAGNLWGLMYGGPESAANLGNSLFTQGVGAIQSQELAGLQNQYQVAQQQQAHEFKLNEQMHGTDEALRQQQILRADDLRFKQQAIDYLRQPGPDGETPEQKQQRVNQLGDISFKRKEGYDWVAGQDGTVIGQVPQPGTPERAKIEQTGHSYSNIADMATKKLWQLENGQVPSVAAWNTEVNSAMMDFRRITEAGAMQAADIEYYETLLPKLMITEGTDLTADIRGVKREQLRVLKEVTERGLQQYAGSTLIPAETYTADDWRVPANFQPTEPPPQQEFNRARTQREQRLEELGSRNERRVRPAIEYEAPSKEGTFALPERPKYNRGGQRIK